MKVVSSIYKMIIHLIEQWRCSKCGATTSTPNWFAACSKGGHHDWKKRDY